MSAEMELLSALAKKSKHSQYQALPDYLRALLGGGKAQAKGRYEKERMEYILGKVDFSGKSVVDVGGNTGYFTFEPAKAGAKSVDYYEGNREHADFVAMSAELLKMTDKIKVHREYMLFEAGAAEKCDVMLLLNVLHHLGDDFGDRSLSIEKAKEMILEKLNGLKESAGLLVFQLGFNWKGKKGQCLFENGTKTEMIEYIRSGTSGSWEIDAIGIAVREGGMIRYEDLNRTNEARNDALGEFLNRPIFIMGSKRGFRRG
jgi:hypothetical protein